MTIKDVPKDLLNAISKACELKKQLFECNEQIEMGVDQLSITYEEKVHLLKSIHDYTCYGYFANVPLEVLILRKNKILNS